MIQVDPISVALLIGFAFALGLLLGFIGGHKVCSDHYEAFLKSVKEGATKL
jgi:hypothetical protein